ncbi:hypothetical protein SAMN02799636_06111 [Methylobacterium sp. 275MFSha3.1]|uniref:hypothetical protein n=1 Tax=Methylobacterium sp. 275MFSha3.1 TaxID=1502746 RepID=UPI0008A786CD|nr:hypothetical protein [Methylobacterium sp. 275MFSha3.1]SEI15814.1 hypothetical protein SAMN02799636_06111 [Methylobacterium sp. 275MFSha3.1]
MTSSFVGRFGARSRRFGFEQRAYLGSCAVLKLSAQLPNSRLPPRADDIRLPTDVRFGNANRFSNGWVGSHAEWPLGVDFCQAAFCQKFKEADIIAAPAFDPLQPLGRLALQLSSID